MGAYITSAQNPHIQHIKQLATSSKQRQKSKQTILDGVHLADAYLRSGGTPEQVVVATESLTNPEVSEILFRLNDSLDIIEVPLSLFERVSSLEKGVALLFVIAQPAKEQQGELATDALLLDTVQDPGNVGAMLRTAAAAGVKDVYLSSGSASAWAPKVLRAGMGAHFTLTIHEGVDLQALISQASVPVVATSLEASHSLYEKDLTDPHAWLFGNEGAGVSGELLELCKDDAVIIPQSDGVESLNVAAATAVCLFEQRRQRITG